jgi:hypothetical protein
MEAYNDCYYIAFEPWACRGIGRRHRLIGRLRPDTGYADHDHDRGNHDKTFAAAARGVILDHDGNTAVSAAMT